MQKTTKDSVTINSLLRRQTSMIKHLLLLTASLSLTVAQGQTWQWAKSAGGNNFDYGQSISNDKNGDIYVTGYFQSDTIIFDSTYLTNAGTGSGYRDIFIAKYNNSGNLLWSKRIGGGANDLGINIRTDANGNSYVTGYFMSPTISFDTIVLTNVMDYDVFVAKYDSSGNAIWAKSAGGTGDDRGSSVCSDKSGNTFVTGQFSSATIIFDNITLTKAGGSDYFIAKYDNLGNIVWAKSIGGSFGEGGRGIRTDSIGNVYVVGDFVSTSIVFDTITLMNSSASHSDIFIVKYSNSGNVIWAKSAGGPGNDYSNCMSIDKNGNTYVTGNFGSDTINFSNIELTNNYSFYFDFFVAKYDNFGNAVWAKSADGNKDDVGTSISTDHNGDSYVTGYFASSNINFDGNILTTASNYINDLFVVKYDGSGNVIWTQRAGGINRDEGNGITSNGNGDIYVIGFYNSNTICGTTNLYSNGLFDIFIAKLNSVTGVDEMSEKENNSVDFFPNPFSTQTTLQTAKPLKNASLTVYNSVGQTVKRIDNLSGQTVLFHRDNLPSGLYFVRLTQDGNTISADKFVIVDE